MTDHSPWTEPMELLDDLADHSLKFSPVLVQQILEIKTKLNNIKRNQEQEHKDLDAIFSVLESIQRRNYPEDNNDYSDF